MERHTFAISVGGIIAAILAPLVTYLLGRKKAGTDAASAITDGFAKLTAALQEERLELLKIIQLQMEENARLRAIIRTLDEAGR